MTAKVRLTGTFRVITSKDDFECSFSLTEVIFLNLAKEKSLIIKGVLFLFMFFIGTCLYSFLAQAFSSET